MNEANTQNLLPHNIFIEERKKISITGIDDILSFDEDNIVLSTKIGELTIKGENLHINNLSLETGDISADGTITAVFYNENINRKDKNILSRIFK